MTADARSDLALLTPHEMGEADRLTIERGISGYDLMKTAGLAVFERLRLHWPVARKITILCGPGNNGGDGFVVAERAKAAGLEVSLGLLGAPAGLTGDARRAYRDWSGTTRPADQISFDSQDVLIDALFGAGLSRPITDAAADCINRINMSGLPVLSVDLPSGLNGLTGQAEGPCVQADVTVTFFRGKPGHFLQPGRSLCGALEIAGIGIADDVTDALGVRLFQNAPCLWRDHMPRLTPDSHKFSRGHVVVVSGAEFQTGASRLSALAALRSGAGLVTLAGPPAALRIHAAHLTSVMLKPVERSDELERILTDHRITALAIGMGLGLDDAALMHVRTACRSGKRLVLDADALTLIARDTTSAFAGFAYCPSSPVLTPHEGEFRRLFPELLGADKVGRARQAARLSHCVVVLKGADTVIAAPDGRAAVNTNAPAWLATAGSGDTLAGIIVSLRAQGMEAFEAACAGVWIHSEAGQICGPFLTGDDLQTGLQSALTRLTADN